MVGHSKDEYSFGQTKHARHGSKKQQLRKGEREQTFLVLKSKCILVYRLDLFQEENKMLLIRCRVPNTHFPFMVVLICPSFSLSIFGFFFLVLLKYPMIPILSIYIHYPVQYIYYIFFPFLFLSRFIRSIFVKGTISIKEMTDA